MEFCKATSLWIVNGRLGSDRCVGKYTCVNVQGVSITDILLTKGLFQLFDTFSVNNSNIT